MDPADPCQPVRSGRPGRRRGVADGGGPPSGRGSGAVTGGPPRSPHWAGGDRHPFHPAGRAAIRLVGMAGRQPACVGLQRELLGVGALTAVFIWAEMGDTCRFCTSDDAVRYAGLDITVYSSDDHRAAGHLARQGPGALRWALYEAAKNASRAASPDHAYYSQAGPASGADRATLSVARKLARKSHHILRNAGDDVLAGWDPTTTTTTATTTRAA